MTYYYNGGIALNNANSGIVNNSQPYYQGQPYQQYNCSQQPNFVITQGQQKEYSSSTSGVYPDPNRNGMYKTTLSSSSKSESFQGPPSSYGVHDVKIHNASKSKTKEKQICSGMVFAANYHKEINTDGTTGQEYVELAFTQSNGVNSGSRITKDQLHDKKFMESLLSDNKVLMLPDGKITDIIRYLDYQISCLEPKSFSEGYFRDYNGLRIKNDDWIFRNAADRAEILELLFPDGNTDYRASFSMVTCILIGCLSRVAQSLRENSVEMIKTFVFISSNYIQAEKDLCRLYCCDINPIIKPDKDFQSNIKGNTVSFLRLSDESDYNVKKILQQSITLFGRTAYAAGEHPFDSLAVMVVKNRQLLRELISSEQILAIPYSVINPNVSGIRLANWFQTLYLKEPNFVVRLKNRAAELNALYLEPLCCEDYLCSTFSLLIAAAECLFLSSGAAEDWLDDFLEEYSNFLIGIDDTVDNSMLDTLRSYVHGEGQSMLIPKENLPAGCNKQKIIGYSSNDIFITSPAFKSIADYNHVTPKALAQNLKEAGVLSCGDKYQKNIVFSEGQTRVYDIRLDKLFPMGQIRLEPDEFKDTSPGLMIELGICGGRQVYFSLSDRKGTDNGHIYITGQSGSGKSYFLKKFARNAVLQGAEVIYICTEDTCPTSEGDFITFEFNEKDLMPDPMSYNDFFSQTLDTNTISEEARILAKLLSDEMSGTFSAPACITKLYSQMGNEPVVEELVKIINSAGRADSGCWNNICQKGQISVVKAMNDDKSFLDEIIRRFYEYKCSQAEITPCLLILDECQIFDLSQGSSIVDLVLRRGRKRGIMAVLTSQYLTAADGRNLSKAIDQCDTYIAFKPGNSADVAKRAGVDIKDNEARNILTDIGKYSCIANGKLSTDRCMINYPLIINIPE